MAEKSVKFGPDTNDFDIQSVVPMFSNYSVRGGDTLSKIASSNNISIDDLIKYNPEIENINSIQIGQNIRIPSIPSMVSKEPDFFEYEVKKGDTLSSIASENNIPLREVLKLNKDIKNINLLSVGQKINLPVIDERNPVLYNYRELRKKENSINSTGDNEHIIKSANHKENYIIVDKKKKSISVYDKNNNLLYNTKNIGTGKSGDDYNTITYVDSNGNLINHKGNNSTPAGITKITGVSSYHGKPSFVRSRYNVNSGKWDDEITSSMHFSSFTNGSNGCVRLLGNTPFELSEYVGEGTMVYTLPEREGSRFVLKEGDLNFIADNPYGEVAGSKKYWDDYNVHIDKTYKPLNISLENSDISKNEAGIIGTLLDLYKGSVSDLRRKNMEQYASGISDNKEILMKEFGVSSSVYNDIAEVALGVAGQESDFGTSYRYILKNMISDELLDFVKKKTRGKVSYRSRGITQTKIKGDNKETRELYNKYNINEDTLEDPKMAGLGAMIRLLGMYRNEVLGRNFTDIKGNEMQPTDILYYKWFGGNDRLQKGIANPEDNEYIKNAKKYSSFFNMTTKFKEGGYVVKKSDISSVRDNTNTSSVARNIELNPVGDVLSYNAGVLPEIEINADLNSEEYRSAMQKAAARRGREYVYKGQEESFPLLAGIAGLGVASSLAGAGVLGAVSGRAMDVADIISDPLNPLNYMGVIDDGKKILKSLSPYEGEFRKGTKGMEYHFNLPEAERRVLSEKQLELDPEHTLKWGKLYYSKFLAPRLKKMVERKMDDVKNDYMSSIKREDRNIARVFFSRIDKGEKAEDIYKDSGIAKKLSSVDKTTLDYFDRYSKEMDGMQNNYNIIFNKYDQGFDKFKYLPIGEYDSNISGFYDPVTDLMAVVSNNKNPIHSVYVHELRHRIESEMGLALTDSFSEIIERAYGIPKSAAKTPDSVLADEMISTNSEMFTNLILDWSKSKGYDTVPWKDIDPDEIFDYIENLDGDKILTFLDGTNSYGKDYANYIRSQIDGKKITKEEAIERIKDALIIVPAAVGAAYVGSTENSSDVGGNRDYTMRDGGFIDKAQEDKNKRWWEDNEERRKIIAKQDSAYEARHNSPEYVEPVLGDSSIRSDVSRDEREKIRYVQNSLFDEIFKRSDFASGYKNAQENQIEEAKDKYYPIKLGADAVATAAELYGAGYTLMSGAKRLGLLNNAISGFVSDSDRAQMIGSLLGTGADVYQLMTADDNYDVVSNTLGTLGGAAGFIGGTNLLRNSAIYGRYGDKMDKALDFVGYTTAGSDLISYPIRAVYNRMHEEASRQMEKKKDGGIAGRKLSKNKEKAFQEWYKELAKYKGLNPNPDDSGHYYDYRAFWDDNQEIANLMLVGNPDAHFTDKYKLPGHPTFSNESIYGGEELGGEWVVGDNGRGYYKPSVYTMSYIDKIMDYLKGTGEGILLDGEYILPENIPNKMKDGGNVRKNQDYIYNRLVNEYGFAPVQAVAIVANLTHESGLTDDILGDNGASYGLQQWKGPRRENLFSFAKSKGHSKPTIDDQIDFLVHEYKDNQAFQFKNKGQNLYQAGKTNKDMFDYFQYSKADFDNAESLWDATIAWNQGVGRPNKKYAFNGRRYEIAVHLANRYGVEYGKERKYTDMGYSDMVQQEPVNTGDKKQDYYENYGKQILVNVLPAQTPSTVQSVSSSETNVEKKLDEDEEYNAEQIEAMRQEQEMEKRRALVAAFLPNIQLKIKGTSKTAN